MASEFEVLARPPPGGELEGRRTRHPQSVAVGIGQFGPAHVDPRSVLLRYDVRRLQLVHRAHVPSDPGRLPAVGIRLPRSTAVPAHVVQAPRHGHPDTDPRPTPTLRRDRRTAPLPLRHHIHRQSQAIPQRHPPVRRAHAQPEPVRRDPGPYHQFVLPGLDLIHPMQKPVQPRGPPLRDHRVPPTLPVVVVRGRPPQVKSRTVDRHPEQPHQSPGSTVELTSTNHEATSPMHHWNPHR